jgi:hypothetical protein
LLQGACVLKVLCASVAGAEGTKTTESVPEVVVRYGRKKEVSVAARAEAVAEAAEEEAVTDGGGSAGVVRRGAGSAARKARGDLGSASGGSPGAKTWAEGKGPGQSQEAEPLVGGLSMKSVREARGPCLRYLCLYEWLQMKGKVDGIKKSTLGGLRLIAAAAVGVCEGKGGDGGEELLAALGEQDLAAAVGRMNERGTPFLMVGQEEFFEA